MEELKLSVPPEIIDKNSSPKIALGMIVKNEELTIVKTITHAIDVVDCIYIYDTGSTDKTLNLIESMSKEYVDKPFFIKYGEFVNFEVTRNELLDWIENHNFASDLDYILLLDANDELNGCEELRKFAADRLFNKSEDDGGFYIQQRWLYGEVIDKYYNIFLIRPNTGWRYHGVVHEYIAPPNLDTAKVPIKCPDNIYIYQNRNENCEQSFIRYNRDKELLLSELEKNPDDTRTLFYLGQTFDCLKLYNEAFHYYTLRANITDKGLSEEVYHSKYRLGNLCIRLNKTHEEILKHYMDAYEFWNRVEPLLRLCEYFLFVRNQPRIAYGYASMALFTPYPSEALLFVSETDYNYRRYNRFMCAAYEVGDFIRAYDIGTQMVKLNIAEETDKNNMIKIKEKLDEFNKTTN